jgi:hypothetical protein
MKITFYALWDDLWNGGEELSSSKTFFCFYQAYRAQPPGWLETNDQFIYCFRTLQASPPKDFSKSSIKLFKAL